ncbi:glycosyltransferase [Bdellovibrio bacteriovorus]|uniref:glycosyltransferase n=1 Tax=Bdellovibrio bacteriovorus TaxID=959 RepID=UPI0035A64103
MQQSVVLLHDWLTGFRGGERVLESFCDLYPQAPLYTLLHSPGTTSQKIENRPITTSFLNRVPGASKHYRKYLPLFPAAAASLKIAENCKVVLSSSHCVIKGVIKPKGSVHISYIHSPMRYLYDQFDSYFGSHAPLYQQFGARAFRNYLTKWDIQSNDNVDFMIANSSFVQERIKRIYKRDSVVIHPFVDLKDIQDVRSSQTGKEEFYLMVTAFAPNKRVDIAIEAFNDLKTPLKIIGSGQQEAELKRMAKANIQFLGNLSRADVINHMQKARAFIFPGIEDFGITPLESLACGTPVIAYKAGGVLETLTEDTGIFFKEPNPQSLKDAIKRFEQITFHSENLHQQAQKFSKEQFTTKISSFITSVSS